MNLSSALSRRDFARLGVSAAVVSTLAGRGGPAAAAALQAEGRDPWLGLKMGVASYTFSKLPLDATIAGIKRVGVHYVSIKSAHLPLESSTAERKEVAKKFRASGLEPLSCGNISMTNDEKSIRNDFEYARDAGIPTIVCSPTKDSLPLLDRMVKEFDIKLAIHNHGPEDKIWPSPFDVWEGVQKYDPRIGLCIDVGHTARCGVNPTDAIRKCSARLYDVHMKDISRPSGKSTPVEVGRGVLDIRGMLQALLEIRFAHHVGLEYEKDMKDPLAGVAESMGYMRGVLSDMQRPSST